MLQMQHIMWLQPNKRVSMLIPKLNRIARMNSNLQRPLVINTILYVPVKPIGNMDKNNYELCCADNVFVGTGTYI